MCHRNGQCHHLRSHSNATAPSSHRRTATASPATSDQVGSTSRAGSPGTIQCVLGRPSQITSRPDLHHLSALFGRREQSGCVRRGRPHTGRSHSPLRGPTGAPSVRSTRQLLPTVKRGQGTTWTSRSWRLRTGRGELSERHQATGSAPAETPADSTPSSRPSPSSPPTRTGPWACCISGFRCSCRRKHSALGLRSGCPASPGTRGLARDAPGQSPGYQPSHRRPRLRCSAWNRV